MGVFLKKKKKKLNSHFVYLINFRKLLFFFSNKKKNTNFEWIISNESFVFLANFNTFYAAASSKPLCVWLTGDAFLYDGLMPLNKRVFFNPLDLYPQNSFFCKQKKPPDGSKKILKWSRLDCLMLIELCVCVLSITRLIWLDILESISIVFKISNSKPTTFLNRPPNRKSNDSTNSSTL